MNGFGIFANFREDFFGCVQTYGSLVVRKSVLASLSSFFPERQSRLQTRNALLAVLDSHQCQLSCQLTPFVSNYRDAETCLGRTSHRHLWT